MAAARRPMVNLLGRVPLFEGCTRMDLSRIAALSEERIYHEGQVIVTAGDSARSTRQTAVKVVAEDTRRQEGSRAGRDPSASLPSTATHGFHCRRRDAARDDPE
jgi:hypothetical protein